MALAHLMGNDAYYSHYVKTDGLLLLDNGLYENSQVTEGWLLSLLMKVIHHRRSVDAFDRMRLEVVAPDALYDGAKTVEQSIQFIRNVREVVSYNDFQELRFMLVPQGRNVEEWSECLRELISKARRLMSEQNITIALSKLSCPKSFTAETGSVYVSINRLAAYSVAKTHWEGSIHLLGAGVPQEWEYYNKIEQIRSCDTSLAAQLAVRNMDDWKQAFKTLGSQGMDTHLNFDEPKTYTYETLLTTNMTALDTVVKS
jgi:hypothetical protein